MPTDPLQLATLSWNLVGDVDQLVSYHFMVNALAAGAIVAVLSAAVGWFVVLRRQAFAGHTLSVVAFPGAAAAALAGLPALTGYFAFCTAAALGLTAITSDRRLGLSSESAGIGALQAFVLGLGFLFVNLYGGVLSGVQSILFGTFLGIDDAQVRTLAIAAVAALAVLAAIARPLLYASVDPEVARAQGVPVRALSGAFLVLLGLAVAATSAITGALLVFALLVMPAATAQQLTPRAAISVPLTLLLALAITWVGLGIAYFSPYPVGFWVTTLAFGCYVLVRAAVWRWRR
jgi:zinc/manganese transport system permease protein